MIRLCFVCLGNICRSPFAEALARREIETRNWQGKILVDSAGTSNEHEGERSHPLSRQVGLEMGLSMNHRARQFKADEFEDWDYILVMDQNNLSHLKRLTPESEQLNKIHLLLDFHPQSACKNVPDPWGYGLEKYHEMRILIEGALKAFFDSIARRHGL
jgi:protein-tyrosine phosphatase